MFNKRALIVLIAAQIACISAQHMDLQVSFDESFWENNLTYVANWGANITTNPTALNYYRDSIDWGTTLIGTTTVSNGVGLSVTIKSSGLSNTSPHSLRLIGLNCGTFTISIPRGFTAVSGLYGITQMPLPAASITYIYNDTSIPNVTVTLNSATYGQSFTSPSLAGPVKALAFNDASGNPCTSTLLTELILDTLVFTTSYIVPTSTVPTSQPSAPTPSSQIAPTPNNMASSSDDGLWWKVLISILGGLLLGCIGCGFLVWWQHRRADQMEHERDEEHKLRDQEKEKYLKDLEAARSAGATVPPKPGKGTSKTTLTGKSTGSQVPQRSTATASPDGKRATNTSRPATTPIPKNRDSSASPKTARRVVPPPKVVEEDSEDQEEEDDESEEEVTPKRPVRPTTLQQQQQGSKSSVNAAKSQTMPAQRPQSSPVVAKSQPSSTVRSQPASAVRSQPASAVKPQPAKKPVPVESEEEEEEETEEEEEESEEEQPQKRVQTMPKPSPVKQNSNLGVDPKRATYSAPASSTKGKPVKKATTAEYDV